MTESVLYGGTSTARVRTVHLQQAKERGERWAMLTAYDSYAAQVFEEAGIPVLLVGDSAGNVVLGHTSTVPVTVEDLLLMTKAVTRSTRRALIVADLPFGSYESGPQQAFDTAVRLMKEGGAQAVKLEGGARVAPQIRLLSQSGMPVMAHIGFTPQSENTLGGFRVQGRGAGAEQLLADAHAVQEAGAFAVVMEMVPAPIAAQVTAELSIPTIGIGAGVGCDAQVLVWPDMAGMTAGRVPRFVKRYADLRGELLRAAQEFATEVRDGTFPAAEHAFE
ncbi:3-methyl-2-oxobutanoate hydroxymethyltransferase [Modestobacter sp. I12A-02628]|uniref:3-methyl-2-oxobutanoate hydroxymethyltransferase n=1 Tax=Goekera deserti TaxID=2497753 RepID=A0A7K3WCN8_9ACTN|nr:3-methyl-2-oxobutanoate hydroxymethyltransferase [Goekera deserti]MPQ97604.1 3-methyl-2-oxobutanoate hydroxymethyltransferase [Goekera deserti]NDI47792.1 3-methyl-2-oxobutanoate hydroxymethyltransferase [Goekera deserti]NEL53540.1 3-methyl-2-oxobutanoate hydroxymethyltransferase [Goekera deserti]